MTVQYCKKGGIFIFTAQMVELADQNGETYECEYGTYNKSNDIHRIPGLLADDDIFSFIFK